MHALRVIVFVLCTILCSADGQVQFRVIRQWKYLNYTWPDAESLSKAKSNGHYVPTNIIISGVAYYKDDYYLTMPRMHQVAVPATLGRITAKSGGSTAPLISPFPSWELNEIGNCSALQNVQNVEIDLGGKMWIIDAGNTGSLAISTNTSCAPKLLIFDIEKNLIEMVHVFPESVVRRTGSYLYDLVLDGDFAYIVDNSARDPGMVVFSFKEMKSWKIRHSKSMRGDASLTNFMVNGVLVPNPVNLAGIALSPKIQGGSTDRLVYYSPITSLHLYSIRTSLLQSESSSNNGMEFTGEVTDVGLKKSGSDGLTMSNKGVLYYGLLSDNSIAKWDTHTKFSTGQTVLTRDLKYVPWTNRLTIDDNGNLVALTSSLIDYIFGKLDITKYNFYLLSAKIDEKSYLYDYEQPLNDDSNLTVKNTTVGQATTSGQHQQPGTSTVGPSSKREEDNYIRKTDNKTIGSSSTKIGLNTSAALLITVILCVYRKY